jgi:DNA-binding SARP family transcriptional activator
VAVYGGEFLPQVDDDWALLERQRLRTLYLDSLYQLTAAYAYLNDFARATTYGRRLSAVEPLREDVHRILMRAYVAMGNRGKAIEQYRICQGELGSELGVQPMPETQALFREIVDPDGARTPSPAARLSATLGVANEHILWVRRTLRRSDERLAEALAMIGRAGNTTPQ